MKIMVTGGAGFIGSHLVDRLMQEGHSVVVIDNLKRGKKAFIAAHLEASNFQFHKQDIRDYNAIEPLFSGCQVVYHLAAQSNVLGAFSDPDYSFFTNVVGTFHVLKAAQKAGVDRFIFSSSREVYGEAEYLPVDERHPLNAKNAYGASKIAGEKYCQVFQKNHGLKTVILRFANVYGTRDSDRVIPIFLRNAQKQQDLIVYGGDQVIDFISVSLAVDALYQSLSNELALTGPTNVGSGKGTTLFELAEQIQMLTKTRSRVTVKPAREIEVVKFIADVRRFHSVFDLPFPDDALYALPALLS